MSTSAQLSSSHTKFGGGKGIVSDPGREVEKAGSSAMLRLLATMSIKNPMYHFEYSRRLTLNRTNTEEAGRYIQPDGGCLWIIREGYKPYLVASCEIKKQGTNKDRAAKGLPKQSTGNAVERLFKNFSELNLYLLNNGQQSFPYVAFCFGDDLAVGCSIRDRGGSFCGNKPYNTVVVKRDADNQPQGSFFIQEEQWTENEIYSRLLRVANLSIKDINSCDQRAKLKAPRRIRVSV